MPRNGYLAGHGGGFLRPAGSLVCSSAHAPSTWSWLRNLAPLRLAPLRLAPLRVAPLRLAPTRVALLRLAPWRLACWRFAFPSLAPWRFACERSYCAKFLSFSFSL